MLAPWAHRHTPLLTACALVALVLWLGWRQFEHLMHGEAIAPPVVQRVSIIQPPMPPPAAITKPPPTPPQVPEPVAEAPPDTAPEPAPTDSAGNSNLGLDAVGTAGGDGFGLTALHGKHGHIGGDLFRLYDGIVQRGLKTAFDKVEILRRQSYDIVVWIWISADGHLEKAELVKGSGSDELDRHLQRALASGLRLDAAPPPNLPQPIKLAITSRF